MRRVFAKHNADQHLRAYQADRNPDHVFAAVSEYLKLRGRLPDWMLENLEHAFKERYHKLMNKPKQNTMRDVLVMQAIGKRYGGTIPKRVDQEFLGQLAIQHRTTVPALKMVVTRARQALADPHYNRARAFRRS